MSTTRIPSDMVGAGDVSDTEHAYLNSLTANVQTAIDAAGGLTGITDNASESAITISVDEEVIIPKQPSAMAHETTNQNNVTGDGTTWKVLMDEERFDQNADYDTSADQFTAPVTGKYLVWISLTQVSMASGHTSTRMDTVSSNVSVQSNNHNPYAGRNTAEGNIQANSVIVLDMDAADTCYFNWKVTGGAKSVAMQCGGVQSYMGFHLLH